VGREHGEDALCPGEGVAQGCRVVKIGKGNFGAAIFPGPGFFWIADHGADFLATRQQTPGYRTAYLPGDTHDCKHIASL
jgi:hypothetical protein